MSQETDNFKDYLRRIQEFLGQEEAGTPAASDDSTRYDLEKSSLECERLRIENRNLEEDRQNKVQDRTLRGQYADKIFMYLFGYSAFGILVVFLDGFKGTNFHLADNVMITIVGGTAVSVIGLVGWVARGLFRAPKDG